jgi:YD repeat-containing protein
VQSTLTVILRYFTLALFGLTVLAGTGFAGQERYEYDPIGRLVRFIDSNSQVTEYTYDPAGNLLTVVGGGAVASLAPVISAVTPNVVRRGETKAITLTGQRLQVGTLQTSDIGMDLSSVRQTASQILADLSVAQTTPTGTQTLTFSNAAGTANIALTVAPKLPVMSIEPSPLALPPDNTPRAVTVRLSGADAINHSITIASSDTGKATVSPASVVIPAGETSVQFNVQPKLAGFVNITVTSPTLQTVVVPVFITADFRGVNTSYAAPVGVLVGDGSVTPSIPPVSATFQSPRVGIAVGPTLTDMTPQSVVVDGTHSFVVRGANIPGSVQVSVLPNQGVAAAVRAVSATEIAVQLTVDAAAAPGLRRLVVVDGSGNLVPFADPAKSQIRLTSGQPAIASIEPLFTTQGATMLLTVRGVHLQNGSLLLSPATDLRVDSAPTVNAAGTELTARVQLGAFAAPGARTVQIATPSGQSSAAESSANQFTIVSEIKSDVSPIISPLVGVLVGGGAATDGATAVGPVPAPRVGVLVGPAAFKASPQVGVLGTSLTLTVTGVGLQSVTAASLAPLDGLAVGAFTVNAEGTSLSMPVTIDAAAPRTLRRVVLSTPAGKLVYSLPTGDQFLVAAAAPELISIAPQVILAGMTSTLSIRGKNFSDVLGVQFVPADGLTVVPPITATDGNQLLTFGVQAAAGATSGPRVVVVTTAGGSSPATASPANTVQVAQQVGPTYDGIFAQPVGVVVGASTPTQSPTALDVYAPVVGVVFGAPAAPVTETQMAFARNVGVVVGVASKGIAQRSPDGFLKGANAMLTVEGFALNQVSGVSIAGPAGVTLGAHAANAQGTELTVPVSVSSTAVSGAFSVSLTTGSGTSTARVTSVSPSNMLFNIGALPTRIDSVNPIILEQGKSYTFTVRGANLKDVYEVAAEPSAAVQFGVGMTAPQWSSDALGEKLTVQLQVDGNAAVGSRSVRLRVPGGITSAEPTPANTITIVAPQ